MKTITTIVATIAILCGLFWWFSHMETKTVERVEFTGYGSVIYHAADGSTAVESNRDRSTARPGDSVTTVWSKP